ncbi:unnamed protein product [Lepeophtheirus salmonis]|uniref:(salmon louse) hypothetical protein n=1 Tax=Lepeophtheirus salmonis TaxID=72036 RepID=A0A7R8H510_LEPSM|nr:unnamed protein product [Lepeophtheirus salmonis]CAF2854273.1 unnamed protein product [Lepeophtheirus salmonis]
MMPSRHTKNFREKVRRNVALSMNNMGSFLNETEETVRRIVRKDLGYETFQSAFILGHQDMKDGKMQSSTQVTNRDHAPEVSIQLWCGVGSFKWSEIFDFPDPPGWIQNQ